MVVESPVAEAIRSCAVSTSLGGRTTTHGATRLQYMSSSQPGPKSKVLSGKVSPGPQQTRQCSPEDASYPLKGDVMSRREIFIVSHRKCI